MAETVSTRRGDWLQTYTGIAFYPLDPRPEEIHAVDIAHQLSMTCRYGGAVDHFYSVAEHSVLLAEYAMEQWPEDHGFHLAVLLHDAAEAYICDIPRPLKHSLAMAGYRSIEAGVEDAIDAAYHLAWTEQWRLRLKDIDTRILIDEASVLLQRITNHWSSQLGEPLGIATRIIGMAPWAAEMRFLEMLHSLEEARKGFAV